MVEENLLQMNVPQWPMRKERYPDPRWHLLLKHLLNYINYAQCGKPYLMLPQKTSVPKLEKAAEAEVEAVEAAMIQKRSAPTSMT